MGQRSVGEWLVITAVVGVAVALCSGVASTRLPPAAEVPEAPSRASVRPVPPRTEAEPVPPQRRELQAGEVECNTTEKVGYARLVEMEEQRELGAVNVVALRDWIRFTPRQAIGAGWLYVEGYEPVAIGWLDGGCLEQIELRERPDGWLTGTLSGAVPGVHYTVGTTRKVGSTSDGSFRVPVVAGSPQKVMVTATFGQLYLTEEQGEVTLAVGEEQEVALSAPALPALGWSLMEVEDGLRVMALLAEGGAARAGLEVGDRIQLVDDAIAADLDGDEVVWDSGPLAVEVWREGEVLTFTVTP